jgi:Predicted exosome subunit
MVELLGTDEFDCDVAESEHGNRLIVLGAELTKQRTFEAIFKKIGKDIVSQIIDDIDNRVDNDCVFYLRLDKQKLIQGEYKVAHHGDVLSLTGKVVSHPARKEIATRNMLQFLNSIQFSE